MEVAGIRSQIASPTGEQTQRTSNPTNTKCIHEINADKSIPINYAVNDNSTN